MGMFGKDDQFDREERGIGRSGHVNHFDHAVGVALDLVACLRAGKVNLPRGGVVFGGLVFHVSPSVKTEVEGNACQELRRPGAVLASGLGSRVRCRLLAVSL